MTFSSFAFIFGFLPVAWLGYVVAARFGGGRWPRVWLFVASIVFFAGAGIVALALLGVSLVANATIASLLADRRERRLSRLALLWIGIAGNVLFLAAFKYGALVTTTVNQIAGLHLLVPHGIQPMGISFYTISAVMLLVDCYEGFVERHTWLDHVVFAGLFPYVSMGPIVRWKQIVPQLDSPAAARFSTSTVACAAYLFSIGLFKKVLLADTLARWADAGFDHSGALTFVGSWLAATAFTFQLYFDFSGYTDMAIGVALLFNITLPHNFDGAFRATSIVDYWRRWHITLTNFITIYLYMPLVRLAGRAGFAWAMAATFVAMTIAGAWHGARWTFLVYGALHGVALVTNQFWRSKRWPIPQTVAWTLTFAFVVGSLAIFRSSDLAQASEVLRAMTGAGGFFSDAPWRAIAPIEQIAGIALMLFGVALLVNGPTSKTLQDTFRLTWATTTLTTVAFATACAVLYVRPAISFLYRQF